MVAVREILTRASRYAVGFRRRSGTLSHGKGRARQARLEFRRSARSPALGPPSIGIHYPGWSERKGSILPRPSRPAAATASAGFCVPPRFPILVSSPILSLSLLLARSISVLRHGVPQNITRSRHSFFTVDRRRGPRDNNGGEERFATAITLTGERSPSSSSAPLGPSCSLVRLEGGRRVGLAG